MAVDQVADGRELRLATEETRSLLSDPGVHLGLACRACVVRYQGKAVAAPGDGRDRLGTEELPKLRDLRLQVVLLDDRVRPDLVEKLALRDHAIAMPDEHQQHVECTRSDGDGGPLDPQFALGGSYLDRPGPECLVQPASWSSPAAPCYGRRRRIRTFQARIRLFRDARGVSGRQWTHLINHPARSPK
jgi:hypothetical protein